MGQVQTREPERICYGDGECGWAVPLDDSGTYRIDNVPFLPRLRYGDVVETQEDGENIPKVTRVVERPYPQLLDVAYRPYTQARYTEVRKAFEAVGAIVEGCGSRGSDGWARVNAPEGVDLHAVLYALERQEK